MSLDPVIPTWESKKIICNMHRLIYAQRWAVRTFTLGRSLMSISKDTKEPSSKT